MRECEKIRPILGRLCEAELDPEEALVAARHLDTCTACRILLARERRLAELLQEELPDPVVVDEGFVGEVMATLPDRPPRRKKRNRKGLKLASLVLLFLLALPVVTAFAPAPFGQGGFVGTDASWATPHVPDSMVPAGPQTRWPVVALGAAAVGFVGQAIAGLPGWVPALTLGLALSCLAASLILGLGVGSGLLWFSLDVRT